jgi:hypothetical protein
MKRLQSYFFLSAFLCGVLFESDAHAADTKRQVVWDGFSFAAENAQKKECSDKVHPSCGYLFARDVEDRFALKLYAVNDDKYVFSGGSDSDQGETLHLTITVSLEWANVVVPLESISALQQDTYVGQYRLCSTLMLYSATTTRYLIENASGKCFVKALFAKDFENMTVTRSFISNFIDNGIENIWLAEASQIIARRQKNYKSITVSSVNIAPSVYEKDDFKRERMRIYVAEKISEELSNVFRKPIIPPSVSGKGAMNLSFGDESRNRTITLWPAKNNLHLSVEPFRNRVVEDKKSGRQVEFFYSILKMTHETPSGKKLLDGAAFYQASQRRVLASSTTEDANSEKVIKDAFYIENIDKLLSNIAIQMKDPDKKWIDGSVYESDPKLVAKGFLQIKDALDD